MVLACIGERLSIVKLANVCKSGFGLLNAAEHQFVWIFLLHEQRRRGTSQAKALRLNTTTYSENPSFFNLGTRIC